MKHSTHNGYQFHVTVFGGRNMPTNTQAYSDAQFLGDAIAAQGYITVNGGSSTGMMGAVSQAAYNAGGTVFGIALANYDPKPHAYLTEFEAYHHHSERQRRLIELGDAYIALPGGVGTFHEILEVHIMNILGETHKPLILVGEYFEEYKRLLGYFQKHQLMHTDATPLYYVKHAQEAMECVNEYFGNLKKQQYHSPMYYPALSPEQIHLHMQQNTNLYEILFGKMIMTVFPGVYPSNRFRSSKLFADIVRREATEKRVADIACGHGSLGLVAIDAGAQFVVQTDINPIAVRNAKYNARKHHFTSAQTDIYEGDTFHPLPKKYIGFFDLILFNPPFHQSNAVHDSHLLKSLVTSSNKNNALEHFLNNAKKFLAPKGKILFMFSNKDARHLQKVEQLFTVYGYRWVLTAIQNTDTVADNRLYTLYA